MENACDGLNSYWYWCLLIVWNISWINLHVTSLLIDRKYICKLLTDWHATYYSKANLCCNRLHVLLFYLFGLWYWSSWWNVYPNTFLDSCVPNSQALNVLMKFHHCPLKLYLCLVATLDWFHAPKFQMKIETVRFVLMDPIIGSLLSFALA